MSTFSHPPKFSERGFTLIEMIVSLGIFSIIVTTAVGALLVLISNNQKLQGEQNVMTNLSFALDSMTREIRTGYNYHCSGAVSYTSASQNNIFEDRNDPESILGTSTSDCASGRDANHQLHGISFFEGGDSILGTSTTDQRILYFFDATTNPKTIKRRVGNEDAQVVISSGLEILDADFIVTGSNPLSAANGEQPTVTVFIQAQEVGKTKTYELQTTVTQRILDL